MMCREHVAFLSAMKESRSHWTNTNNLSSTKTFFTLRERSPPNRAVAGESPQRDQVSLQEEGIDPERRKPVGEKRAPHGGDSAGLLAQETVARALSDPRLCPQQRVMTTDMSSTLSATETLSLLPALSCRPSRVGLKKLELQISPTEPESVLTILARGNHDPLTNPPLIKVFDVN